MSSSEKKIKKKVKIQNEERSQANATTYAGGSSSFFQSRKMDDIDDEEEQPRSKCCCLKKKQHRQVNNDPNESLKQITDNSHLDPDITDSERRKKRSEYLWGVLRKHVRKMQMEMRFFSAQESKKNDLNQNDKMFEGLNEDDEVDEDENAKHDLQRKRSFQEYIIIHPQKSTMKVLWDNYIYLGLGVNFFLMPLILSFDAIPREDGEQTLYEKTWYFTLIFDISFALNILLNFITAYQQDIEWKFELKLIAKAYVKSYFLFDMLSVVPVFIKFRQEEWYGFRLFRYQHYRRFIFQINHLFQVLFNKIAGKRQIIGLNKQIIERILYFISLLIYLILIIHILSCTWVYIGISEEGSWLDNLFPYETDQLKIYILSIYFIITTLTTVGYGDIYGFQNNEHIFQMVVEFIGIGFFSFLMGSINNILVQESKLQDIIDERIEDLDIWLRKLDKYRSNKQLPQGLYDSIREYVAASFVLDFNLIQTYEFYEQLKPKLKYKLINELFGNFKTNFYYMFEDEEFEAGQEFISDFLSNLYCRIYIPGSYIIKPGETFPELSLIYRGIVIISLKGVSKENDFFVLPTYSYFGDYQILYDLQSQISYRAGDSDHTYTMCMKKRKLKEMLEDYPDARKFYMTRAWERRIEFRRLMKKHQRSLYFKKQNSSISLSEKYSDDDDNDDDDDEEEEEEEDHDMSNSVVLPSRKILNKLNEQDKMEEDWLENDIPLDDLKEISEDEKKESRKDHIKNTNKKKSQQNADHIQFQMKELTQAFYEMNHSLETNLKTVNDHIKDVQNGNLNAETPHLESLGNILSQLGKKLQQNIKDAVERHKQSMLTINVNFPLHNLKPVEEEEELKSQPSVTAGFRSNSYSRPIMRNMDNTRLLRSKEGSKNEKTHMSGLDVVESELNKLEDPSELGGSSLNKTHTVNYDSDDQGIGRNNSQAIVIKHNENQENQEHNA